MKAKGGRYEFGVGHKARPTRESFCGSGVTPDSKDMDHERRSRQVGQVSDLPQDQATAEGGSKSRTTPSRLWLWIVAAFVLQALAWTAWFTIAARHPVQEVPLATTPAR